MRYFLVENDDARTPQCQLQSPLPRPATHYAQGMHVMQFSMRVHYFSTIRVCNCLVLACNFRDEKVTTIIFVNCTYVAFENNGFGRPNGVVTFEISLDSKFTHETWAIRLMWKSAAVPI